MANVIQEFKVGDRIVQRMRKGEPRCLAAMEWGMPIPMSGTITDIVVSTGKYPDHYEVRHYIDGVNVGYLDRRDWMYTK